MTTVSLPRNKDSNNSKMSAKKEKSSCCKKTVVKSGGRLNSDALNGRVGRSKKGNVSFWILLIYFGLICMYHVLGVKVVCFAPCSLLKSSARQC